MDSSPNYLLYVNRSFRVTISTGSAMMSSLPGFSIFSLYFFAFLEASLTFYIFFFKKLMAAFLSGVRLVSVFWEAEAAPIGDLDLSLALAGCTFWGWLLDIVLVPEFLRSPMPLAWLFDIELMSEPLRSPILFFSCLNVDGNFTPLSKSFV